MKITKIETVRLTSRPTLIWVRVHTDEGLIGLGESWFGCAAIDADIHERIAPALIGADPSRIEALTRAARPYVGFCGTGAEIRAASAIDVALWDIVGQAAGKPLYALLGGATRDDIRVYNTCAGPDYVSQSSDVRPENFGLSGSTPIHGRRYEDLKGFMTRPDELAAELLEMSISSMKIWPFDFAAGALDGVKISPEDLTAGMAPFESIRKAHGDRMSIKAELHGIWGLGAAKAICAALEPIRPDWVEDPIWMDRTADIAELTASTRAPLAGGETLGGLGQLRELIAVGVLARRSSISPGEEASPSPARPRLWRRRSRNRSRSTTAPGRSPSPCRRTLPWPARTLPSRRSRAPSITAGTTSAWTGCPRSNRAASVPRKATGLALRCIPISFCALMW
jgi:galactonate dehydratase